MIVPQKQQSERTGGLSIATTYETNVKRKKHMRRADFRHDFEVFNGVHSVEKRHDTSGIKYGSLNLLLNRRTHGKTITDEGFDFILLHAKFFVYKCTLNELKPTLEAFMNNLKHIYEVDKHVHLMEMTYEQFVKKWIPYNHLVT